MRSKSIVLFFVLSFLLTAFKSRAQVTYSAREGKLPFTIGTGISDFSDDWGIKNPRQVGITVWADWRLPHLPARIIGLGIEFEGRDIHFATPSYLPGHRMDTALGGPIYQFHRQSSIRPFVKYLMGIGSIDFPTADSTNRTTYTHDTRAIFAPAGGVDFRLWNRFSVRSEYEYQYWHVIFGPRDLTPNGFSGGVLYDFGHRGGS